MRRDVRLTFADSCDICNGTEFIERLGHPPHLRLARQPCFGARLLLSFRLALLATIGWVATGPTKAAENTCRGESDRKTSYHNVLTWMLSARRRLSLGART